MSYTKKELMEYALAALVARQTGYPKEVFMGRMKQKTATEQIDKMQAIYRVLAGLPDNFIYEQQNG